MLLISFPYLIVMFTLTKFFLLVLSDRAERLFGKFVGMDLKLLILTPPQPSPYQGEGAAPRMTIFGKLMKTLELSSQAIALFAKVFALWFSTVAVLPSPA
jgi:hypothetical protein